MGPNNSTANIKPENKEIPESYEDVTSEEGDTFLEDIVSIELTENEN
jgi:hypothetical protein